MGTETTQKRLLGKIDDLGRGGLQKAVYADASSGGVTDHDRFCFQPYQWTTSYRSGSNDHDRLSKTVQETFTDSEQSIRWPFDTGHNFYTEKLWPVATSHPYVVARGYNNSYYAGPVHAMDPTGYFTGHDPFGPSRIQLPRPGIKDSEGTAFLKETLPGMAEANLTQLITELVIDLPKIPFNGLDSNLHRGIPFGRKNVGGEYLNVVFGWEPLVRDVLKVCEAIVKIDSILTQYVRDSGRVIRRKRRRPIKITNDRVVHEENAIIGMPVGSTGAWWYPELNLFTDPSGNGYNQPNGYRSTRGQLTLETTSTEEYWFSGAWMYYLDMESSMFEKLRSAASMAKKTLGIRTDINVLYELAPWSWLLDWFVNIGDLLAVNTALANDSTVLRYGYLMHRTTTQQKYQHTGVLFADGTATGPVTSIFRQETKQRRRATPYGFGIEFPDLSPARLAILGSLIATHGSGSSRF
jgi:hypothetical protein